MSLVYIYDLPTFFLCPSIKIHDGATFINNIDFVCCTTSNHAGDNPAKSLKYWKYFPKPPFSVTVPLDKTPESNSFFSIWGHTFCRNCSPNEVLASRGNSFGKLSIVIISITLSLNGATYAFF